MVIGDELLDGDVYDVEIETWVLDNDVIFMRLSASQWKHRVHCVVVIRERSRFDWG